MSALQKYKAEAKKAREDLEKVRAELVQATEKLRESEREWFALLTLVQAKMVEFPNRLAFVRSEMPKLRDALDTYAVDEGWRAHIDRDLRYDRNTKYKASSQKGDSQDG